MLGYGYNGWTHMSTQILCSDMLQLTTTVFTTWYTYIKGLILGGLHDTIMLLRSMSNDRTFIKRNV